MKIVFITGYISTDMVRAVSWTLLHSLWQGLIAAALAGLVILATRHSKAALRYNLLSIVFSCFIIGTLVTFFYQPGIINPPASGNNKLYLTTVFPGPTEVNHNPSNWIPALQRRTFFQPIVYYANKYSALITGVWALFFFINFLKMISGLRYAYRLRYLHTVLPAREWKERLYTLSSLLGMHYKVLLKESGRIKVPVVVGFLKPVILVPLGMFAHLSVEQVESIFVHELAHIRRKDFAVNLLQRFAESVFFFNPFVGWVSALIREEREACCDDIVLEYTTDKKTYLEALVSFREVESQLTTYAIGLGGTNSLLNRAKRILTNENKKLNAMEKITLGIIVIAFTAFGFIPEKKLAPEKAQPLKKMGMVALPEELTQPLEKDYVRGGTPSFLSKKDTVPVKGITFNNISSNNNDDGKVKTNNVIALGSDGKKYSYKMVNDEIQEFSVDGRSVGRDNFKKYKIIIDEIEEQWRKNINQSLYKQKNALDLLQTKQLSLKQQQLQLQLQSALLLDSLRQIAAGNESELVLLKNQEMDLDKKNMLVLENKLNGQHEIQENNKLDLVKSQLMNLQLKNQLLDENKFNLQNKMQLNNELELLKNGQSALDDQSKWQLNKLAQLSFPDNQIAQIIDEIEDAGVIRNRKELSFTLNYDELIVNGKKQGAALHADLKEKYIKSRKEHYIYKTNGHSTSTDIVRD